MQRSSWEINSPSQDKDIFAKPEIFITIDEVKMGDDNFTYRVSKDFQFKNILLIYMQNDNYIHDRNIENHLIQLDKNHNLLFNSKPFEIINSFNIIASNDDLQFNNSLLKRINGIMFNDVIQDGSPPAYVTLFGEYANNVRDAHINVSGITLTGTYFNEYGKGQEIPIWYDAYNCMFNLLGIDGTSRPIAPSKVYISTALYDNYYNQNNSYYRVRFRKFTNIYVDLIDGPFPIMLQDTVMLVNENMKKQFDKLKKQSILHLATDQELPLKTKISIECSDGIKIPFYPYAVKIFYDLEKSPFNTQNFDIESILLDYPSNIVKPLLNIFYLDSLPNNLLNMIKLEEDWLTIYARISDMLGFEFFSTYFNIIIKSDEYRALLIE